MFAYDRLAPFGVDILDVDLRDGLTIQGALDLSKVLHDNLVVVFRAQQITPTQLIEISRHIGFLAPALDPRYVHVHHPEISVVGRTEAGGVQRVLYVNDRIEWHYDYAQTATPALASFLYAVEVPDSGGDTLFANTREAYETLGEPMRSAVDGASASFSGERLAALLDAADPLRSQTDQESCPTSVVHPIVQVHPVTGRRALLLAPEIMDLEVFAGGNVDVSELLRHCTSDRFVYRHRWLEGDLVLYDNLSLIHTATPLVNSSDRRVLYRTTMLPEHSGQADIATGACLS